MKRLVFSCLTLTLLASTVWAQDETDAPDQDFQYQNQNQYQNQQGQTPRYQDPRLNQSPNRNLMPPPITGPGGELASQILNYERTQNSEALLLAYGQAVTDPTLARAAISQLLSSYYVLRNQAQTAEQATQAVSEANLRFQVLQAAQNQVLVQQNQQILAQNAQIIALLRDNQRAATAPARPTR